MYRYIPTLPPQLYIEQRFGEFPFHWCLLKINIYDKYIIISRKLQPIIPCIEECLHTPLSDRLLASRLSPSSLVGGTLRGLAPEGRIYQSEQFYISANTTEEDCTDLTSYGMGIKIPCKSHCGRAWLYAGYKTTLFQKVIIRYPFILPSSCSPIVTIAPQKYNEFLNPARNVNFVLTFGCARSEWCCRKIAAMRKSLCHNTLHFKILRLDGCKFVVLNVVGSSPTGHPTIKPIDYQIVNGYFCTKNLPNPP